MLSKRNSLIVLGACLLFAQACRQKTALMMDAKITHEISPQHPRVGPVAITLKMTDSSGKSVSGAHFSLEGNMSHAGMTPVFAEATETGAGIYRATMNLSMAGDWRVVARATLPDGRKLEYEFEINGVAPA